MINIFYLDQVISLLAYNREVQSNYDIEYPSFSKNPNDNNNVMLEGFASKAQSTRSSIAATTIILRIP